MVSKATAVAPSNIAFVKYWGKKDESLRLPSNGSISMNLNGLTTTTTVEFLPELAHDEITIDDKQVRSAYNGINRIVENNRVVAWGQVR